MPFCLELETSFCQPMKFSNLLLTVFVILVISGTTLLSEEKKIKLNLMPMPATIVFTDAKFRLLETFTVGVKGRAGNKLYKGATRVLTRLSGRTGLFFSQDCITPSNSRDSMFSLIIKCQRPGRVVLHEDESYRLVIGQDKIKLTAKTDIGALRGLETLLQLLSVDNDGYYFPTLTIEDYPRFPWRGLLIDACRHFMPVEVIKRNLDGMAAVKMNVLHWHLSDDQGFRVECKTYPKLHQLGSDGFYYTQKQIKEIIVYAAERGIRIIPEFDIPGHSTSWLVAYPKFASAAGPYEIKRKWGIFDPAFDPTRKETYKFFNKFFKEMAHLFPDEYMHIGGDEVNGKQWDANPKIQLFMKAHHISDNRALQSYFNRRLLKILTKYGKKMVGWNEIFQPEIPTDIVIQSWRGREALAESAKKGYQGILSNGYYIDLIQPTDFHYLNDPLPEDSPLTDNEKKLILGGEATMWTEFVSPENIDSRIWPRTAAIAERLWSPATINDVDDMYRRLEVISFRLEELGLTHEKNYRMMLRRLANNGDITALKNLVDVIEPVKNYTRNKLREHTSFSPLTRVVDAARPDAKVARNFRNLVDSYLAGGLNDKAKLASLKKWLTLWQNNHADLVKTISISPILKEIETLSEDLSKCAAIGLAALKCLQNGKQTDKDWIKSKLEILEKAKEPRGQTELMIIPAIEKLVNSLLYSR